MEEENVETKSSVINQLSRTDVLLITLKRWPWILLSLTVCMGLAALYLMRATPLYTRTASVVIKDDTKGNSASAEIDAFADMGLLQSHSNIIDEINKLQSPDMMKEAVKRLGINKSYTTDGRFRKEVIYGTTLPITVTFPSLTDAGSASATVTINTNGTYTLSDVVFNDEDVRVLSKGAVKLGQPTPTSAGPVDVKKTPYYVAGNDYKIYVNRTSLKRAVDHYLSELSVDQKNDKGNTINLTVTDPSIERAEDLINTVISVYNEKWIENRNQISVATSNFITERLGVIEGELGNVDQDISSYQSEHLIPDVQQAANIYMTENQATSAQILELNSRLQMTRYLRNYLNNESHKEHVLPVNTGIGNAAIEANIAEYNSKLLQRNQYKANSSENHPLVVDLDTELAGLRSSILSATDNEVTSLETQIRNLQGSKNNATAQIAANPTQAKYLLSMERQQKVKESLYLFLLQKREENELSQAFTAYNTQVINTPNGKDVPSSPVALKILMIAFVIGWIIPFGVTYLLETFNTKVRGRKDIEHLSLPFLGEIPACRPRKGEKNESRIVVKAGRRNVINEAFRVLRTNISFVINNTGRSEAIMVTSFNPGSGKTFITMNLADSFAIKGRKVVVIDCDLRRASTSAYVGSPKTGISNYLVGEVDDYHKVLVSDTIVKNLSVMPVGTMPPNPTELLESPKFADLIEKLREEFDIVFIDCPPMEMMADAQIVNSLIDRTMFVVRAGLFERSLLPELERIYNEKKYKNMALVLNDTQAESSPYGYKYGYGYGYGYGNYTHYMN